MSNFGNRQALNRDGRAFALASGFGSAMGSGVAVASASTSAYMDNLKIQAVRPRSRLPVANSSAPLSNTFAPANRTSLQRNSFLPRISSNPSINAIGINNNLSTQPIGQLARTKSFANLSTAVAPIAGNFSVPDNVDPNPVVFRKKPADPVNYTQQVSVKFLQPPPPQQPGDIVITQQKDVQAPSVTPKLIRQNPPLPIKPAPLVVRERPPLAPAPIPPEHHVIPGKVIPPPPRKVVIERLPQLPQPPQDILVERWLEYGPRARRVIFTPAPPIIPAPAPKNVLIQWDSPNVALNRQYRNLGITTAIPAQYAATFGASMVPASSIPVLSRSIRPPNGARLAAEHPPHPVRLVGDVVALALINRAANHASAPGLFTATTAGSSLASASDFTAPYASFSANSSSFLGNNSATYHPHSTNTAVNGPGLISSRAPIRNNNATQARHSAPANRGPIGFSSNNYRSNSIPPTQSGLPSRVNQAYPARFSINQQRSNSVLPTRSILTNNNNGNFKSNQALQAMSIRSNSVLPTRSRLNNIRTAGQNMPYLNINRPNISGPNISRPNISGPNISRPNIYGPNISRPNISGPNISRPNISGPNISRPNFSRPNITRPVSSFNSASRIFPQRSQSVMQSRNLGSNRSY